MMWTISSLRGVSDANVPRIVTADKISDLDEKKGMTILFLISGKIADAIDVYKGVEAISAITNVEKNCQYN